MTKIIKLANGVTVLTEQRAGTGKVAIGFSSNQAPCTKARPKTGSPT